jgi:hypothetical protein
MLNEYCRGFVCVYGDPGALHQRTVHRIPSSPYVARQNRRHKPGSDPLDPVNGSPPDVMLVHSLRRDGSTAAQDPGSQHILEVSLR